jgi:enoyl-CoA hydratase/carnithine racemase
LAETSRLPENVEHPNVSSRLIDRGDGRIAFVTIDNETKLNVLGSGIMDQFVAVFADLHADTSLRAVVLSGSGERSFVGGADVNEMALIGSPDEARAFITRVHRCCAAVRDLPVPVIGRINGFALGAGLELAAACDFRVASESAIFGMPEVRLGIPSVVEAALLPGLIGWGRTRELLLLGETFNAQSALNMGLVDAIYPYAELDEAIELRLSALLKGAPNAIRLQKALIRRWEDLPLGQAIAAGINSFAQAFLTDEPGEAMAAWQSSRRIRPKPQ